MRAGIKTVVAGLYAITPQLETEEMLKRTRLALEGGARIVQYRNKTAPVSMRHEQAGLLHRLCQEYEVPLIINDDVRVCQKIGVEGVHLGREDISLEHARQRLGEQAIIGMSCYNSLDRALHAQASGADYVAFGCFFVSSTKPDAVQAPVSLLHQARRKLAIPVIAIGGITLQNGHALVTAGADGLAVIEGLYGAADIRSTATEFSQWFNQEADHDNTFSSAI
ncbi:MAG: thiamine phosphate synthase [Gammaproteobacteria bacterium]|nr:MAG: thiamine phosphate synthase [Gammaproteobacteria bacterium]